MSDKIILSYYMMQESEYYDPENCDWCRIEGKEQAESTQCNHVLCCDECGQFCDACPHDFYLCGNCCEDQCKTSNEPSRTNPNYIGNITEDKE